MCCKLTRESLKKVGQKATSLYEAAPTQWLVRMARTHVPTARAAFETAALGRRAAQFVGASAASANVAGFASVLAPPVAKWAYGKFKKRRATADT